MEENNETTTPPAAPDEPQLPPVPVEVAPPVEPGPAEEDPAAPSLAERLGGPTSKLRTLQGPPVVALAVASFVLLVVSVLLALMVFAPGIAPFRMGSARAGYAATRDLAISKVAVRFGQNFLTFDYRTLDTDLGRLAKDSTGNFASQLTRVQKQQDLINTLKTQQATSRGTVEGQTVESIHGDTATVKVFVTQSVTNKSNTKPATSFKELVLTLVKTPKGWKVDNVG